MNGDYLFDVRDPVPDGHPVYDKPNKGMHVLFNAARDDLGFQVVDSRYDVVTDGNQPLKRKLSEGESTTKRLPGRPRTRSRKSMSRCMVVGNDEKVGFSRAQTGVLFVTMNMKRAGKGEGYEILNLVEMLDGENKPVKEFAIRDLQQNQEMQIRT